MGLLPVDFYGGRVSNVEEVGTSTTPLLKDYVINLETGHLVVSESGQFIICTGLRAIIMQMWRKLHTMKGQFEIYNSKYGNTFDELLGKGKAYADAFAFTKVQDCIVDRTYVKSISNFKTSLTQDNYTMTFTAKTIYGDTEQKLGIELE